jgi:signal transduction histidine kinase
MSAVVQSHYDIAYPNTLLGVRNFIVLCFCILCGCGCVSTAIYAQQSKVDSIQTVLTTLKNDTTRVRTLNDLALLYYSRNAQKTMDYAKEALALAEQLRDTIGICDALRNMGVHYEMTGAPKKAIDFYQQALLFAQRLRASIRIARAYKDIGDVYGDQALYPEAKDMYNKAKTATPKEDIRGLAGITLALGNLCMIKGDYKDGLENYEQARVLYETINDQLSLARVYVNMANLYVRRSAYGVAGEYALRAMKIFEDLSDKQGITVATNILGNIYNEQGLYDKALSYYYRSLELFKELGHKRNRGSALVSIGEITRKQGKSLEAMEMFTEAKRLFIEAGYTEGELIATNNMCDILLDQGNTVKSIQLLQESLAYANQHDLPRMAALTLVRLATGYLALKNYTQAETSAQQALTIAYSLGIGVIKMTAYTALASVAEARGQFPKALEYERKNKAVADSIYTEDLSTKLAAGQNQYEAARREQTIRLLEKDKALLEKDKSLLQQNNELLEKNKALQFLEIERNRLARMENERLVELLKNENQIRSLGEIQERLEREKKQKEIELVTADKEAKQLELDKRNSDLERSEAIRQSQEILRNSLVLGIILAFVLMAVLYNRYRLQQRGEAMLRATNHELVEANIAIRSQQTVVEEQTRQIEETNVELYMLNDAMREKNVELQNANAFKTHILSIAAHDLKNPLSSVRLSAELLLERGDRLPPEKRLKKLHEIVEMSERMVHLIRDILDAGALEFGMIALKHEIMDISHLLRETVIEYQQKASLKQQVIILSCPDEFLLTGDLARLQQVFDNLISNAVKYSPINGTVFVTAQQIASGTMEISIKDQGQGLTEEDKGKMFNFFQRLSAQPTGGESSTGVGLAIVKQIIDLHKGTIVVESTYGQGAEFIVTLPIAQTIDPATLSDAIQQGSLTITPQSFEAMLERQKSL